MKTARSAKVLSDKRGAALERLERLPSLKASMIERHGSVEAYLDSLDADESAELERDLADAMKAFERSRADALSAAGPKREAAFEAEIAFLRELREGLARGARAGRHPSLRLSLFFPSDAENDVAVSFPEPRGAERSRRAGARSNARASRARRGTNGRDRQARARGGEERRERRGAATPRRVRL